MTKIETFNIAARLEHWADQKPESVALIEMRSGRQRTFKELEQESSRLASGLVQFGMKSGERVLLMVPYGIDFVTLTFAMFKAGLIPVLIDPGLGKKNVLKCIKQVQPHGMIAIPLAHAIKKIFPANFKSIQHNVTVGTRWFWGGASLNKLLDSGKTDFKMASMEKEHPAAILFTSGSTGPAKGVLFSHGIFNHQVRILQEQFDIQPDETDLPTFPLFGLFSSGLGMTSIIPDMDSTKPAHVDPKNIIIPIQNFKISSSFGSPALWDTVSQYCLDQNIQLPTLKRIIMAGGPVSGDLLARFETIVDKSCKIYTPYGATEVLPVSLIDRREILDETWSLSNQGKGTCVGHPIPGVEIKIIEISDQPILKWQDITESGTNIVGEIAVKAEWATRTYFNRQDLTQLAKIEDGNSFWHRMGDLGRLDEKNRLWFYGRKNQRVVTEFETLYTIPCEAIFNQHPDVKRSALVGTGYKTKPVIIIEPVERIKSQAARQKFTAELLERGAKSSLTQSITKVLFHEEFPVDVRHNAKIFREKLSLWAENQK
ncbi:fatty acid CoA ligase family protein [Nitrospinaceae bacterium]|nr:fatty acid CoA ligase family protein [Nitrospinaceae bacterium]